MTSMWPCKCVGAFCVNTLELVTFIGAFDWRCCAEPSNSVLERAHVGVFARFL